MDLDKMTGEDDKWRSSMAEAWVHIGRAELLLEQLEAKIEETETLIRSKER